MLLYEMVSGDYEEGTTLDSVHQPRGMSTSTEIEVSAHGT